MKRGFASCFSWITWHNFCMQKTVFLIAEHNPHDIYMGWHLYLRDHKEKNNRNDNGGWGWLRGIGKRYGLPPSIQAILDHLGICIRGDGTCDDDGVAEIARRFPIPRERIGGRPRGCIELAIGNDGELTLKAARKVKV
jgi:hypothetical protein